MLELKKDQNSRIVMYGYKSKVDYLYERPKTWEHTIFEETRSELLCKGEDFWGKIVKEAKTAGYYWCDYSNDAFCCETAKESGHSALSLIKGEYILIVREKV